MAEEAAQKEEDETFLDVEDITDLRDGAVRTRRNELAKMTKSGQMKRTGQERYGEGSFQPFIRPLYGKQRNIRCSRSNSIGRNSGGKKAIIIIIIIIIIISIKQEHLKKGF